MKISWISLLLIDIIYAIQFVTFIQWYYPKMIIVSCVSPNFVPLDSLIAILELITCYIISMINVRKLSKE